MGQKPDVTSWASLPQDLSWDGSPPVTPRLRSSQGWTGADPLPSSLMWMWQASKDQLPSSTMWASPQSGFITWQLMSPGPAVQDREMAPMKKASLSILCSQSDTSSFLPDSVLPSLICHTPFKNMALKPPHPSKANSGLKIPFVKNKNKKKNKALAGESLGSWEKSVYYSLSNSVPKLVWNLFRDVFNAPLHLTPPQEAMTI